MEAKSDCPGTAALPSVVAKIRRSCSRPFSAQLNSRANGRPNPNRGRVLEYQFRQALCQLARMGRRCHGRQTPVRGPCCATCFSRGCAINVSPLTTMDAGVKRVTEVPDDASAGVAHPGRLGRQAEDTALRPRAVRTPPAEGAPSREDASRFCPVCSRRLESRRCKLVCNECGYYMSCADYY